MKMNRIKYNLITWYIWWTWQFCLLIKDYLTPKKVNKPHNWNSLIKSVNEVTNENRIK